MYECLKAAPGIKFSPQQSTVILADGSKQKRDILCTTVPIKLKGRTFEIDFIIFPDARDNRTLLGIDFLEKAGIVPVLPQRCWYYVDRPDQLHPYASVKPGSTPELCYQSFEDVTTRESLRGTTANESPFLSIYTSPLPDELSYQLHPLELDPIGQENHNTSYENSDAYSAAEIDNIFQDAISTLYQPTPRDPRKRGRYDIFSLDIVLTTEEAPQLSETQRKLFNGMLLKQERRFAKEGPATTFTEHRIRTNSAVPIATAPYRLSAQRQRLLRHKLDEMLAQGIIKESDTPWAAPVVLVPKENDDVRVCVDYRRLNTCTIPDRYPLPRTDDLLHLAKSLPYMSSLDLQAIGRYLFIAKIESKPDLLHHLVSTISIECHLVCGMHLQPSSV